MPNLTASSCTLHRAALKSQSDQDARPAGSLCIATPLSMQSFLLVMQPFQDSRECQLKPSTAPQVTHPEMSPLVLCDSCTRSFHMACLGLEWAQLPEGDWECPKCGDKKDAAVRRLLDFELRRVENDK